MFRKVLSLALATATFSGHLIQPATAEPTLVPADVTVVYSRIPTSLTCGRPAWFNSKIIINKFNDADELLCGYALDEESEDEGVGFVLKDRVTRFHHFNSAQFYLTKGFNDHEVYWEWGKQGEPFSTGIPYTLKAKIGLNATTIADQKSMQWTLICESIFFLDNGTEEEVHAAWEKPVTVSINGCDERAKSKQRQADQKAANSKKGK